MIAGNHHDRMIHAAVLISSIFESCGHVIYPYLDKYSDLIQLSACNSIFSRIVLQSDHWSTTSLDCCLDAQCYKNYCGRKKISKYLLYRLLIKTSTHRCSLHVNVEDLSNLLYILQYNSHLNTLHIRFRLSNPPSKTISQYSQQKLSVPDSILKLIVQTSNQHAKIPLQHLSIYSHTWNSPVLDFEAIISNLGHQLLSLHFEESSPSYLFPLIQKHCPSLENLTVEGNQSTEEFFQYYNSQLKFLRLHETQIDLSSQHVHLPHLQRLEFIDAVEPIDCIQSIQKLPFQLQELEIQIKVESSEACIFTIGQVLFNLQILIVRLRDADSDDGNELFSIGAEAMTSLCKGCPNLVCLEILDRLVGGLSFEAFIQIPDFQRLEHICIAFSPTFVEFLPKLLSESATLNDVILFEDASYYNKPDDVHPSFTQWEVMAAELEAIAERLVLIDSYS